MKKRKIYILKKQFSKKLVKQALYGENIFAQITALIILARNGDPESGWLLETLLKSKRIFKSGAK